MHAKPTKQGHVGKNRFENIIAEFAPEFENLKPLARELRSALFPIRDGDIFTGTFHDHSIMYDGMIEAFDGAITSLRKEYWESALLFWLGGGLFLKRMEGKLYNTMIPGMSMNTRLIV